MGMKKCVLILSFIMLSTGAVFARFHESYELYVSQDCYRHGHHTYCRPRRIPGYSNYRMYYPQTGVSINVGNYYGPVYRAIQAGYHTNKRGKSTSVFVSI